MHDYQESFASDTEEKKTKTNYSNNNEKINNHFVWCDVMYYVTNLAHLSEFGYERYYTYYVSHLKDIAYDSNIKYENVKKVTTNNRN